MAVQNFHVVATIDGRANDLTGGPRAKDGGIKVIVKQRDNGAIFDAVIVNSWVSRDGKDLITEVCTPGNEAIRVVSPR